MSVSHDESCGWGEKRRTNSELVHMHVHKQRHGDALNRGKDISLYQSLDSFLVSTREATKDEQSPKG